MQSLTFTGNESELTALLKGIGLVGSWTGTDPKEFILIQGPKVRWWPKTGTVHVQGKPQSLVDDVTNRIEATIKAYGNPKPSAQHPAIGTILTLGYVADAANGEIELTIKKVRKA